MGMIAGASPRLRIRNPVWSAYPPWVYFRIVEKPEPAQAHVIGLPPALLDKRIHPEIFSRLDDWRSGKACAGSSCGDLLAERAAKRGGKR